MFGFQGMSLVIGHQDALNDALERMDELGYERGTQGNLVNHGPRGTEARAVFGHGDLGGDVLKRYAHHQAPVPPLRSTPRTNPPGVPSWERGFRIWAEEYLATHAMDGGVFLILLARAVTPVWEVARWARSVIVNLAKKRAFVNHYSFHILDQSAGI